MIYRVPKLLGNLQSFISHYLALRKHAEFSIATGRGEREDTLGSSDGLVMCIHAAEMDRQKAGDSRQALRVVESRREGLSLTQVCQGTLPVVRGLERRARRKPQVDGLLTRGTRLRQVPEGTECLLEVSHRLAVGRVGQRMLEGIGALGTELRLIEELRRLEVH
jgi:hypothetical protein